MGPGVPGMGLASIFYIAAALVAPLREIVKSVRGESSANRWAAVGRQFAMAVGVISSIVWLYLGFDALMARGLLGTQRITHLPGDYPVWTYALGVLIVLMAALALASWVLVLRVRWGSIGEDTGEIAVVYRASIPVHEALRQHGVSKGRHRATSRPPVTSLSALSDHMAATNRGSRGTNHRPLRGRHVDDRHSPLGAPSPDVHRPSTGLPIQQRRPRPY